MASDSDETINSDVLQGLRDGRASSLDVIVDKYFFRIVRAAEKRISDGKQRATDGEDVAASVFESLWRMADKRRFQEGDVQSADELWSLLCRMVRNKVTDHMRREKAAKRGGGEVRGDSVFLCADGYNRDSLSAATPSHFQPDELVAFAEQKDLLLGALETDEFREIATLRLEGYEVRVIAERLSLSERSITRKLAIIRDIWSKLITAQAASD